MYLKYEDFLMWGGSDSMAEETYARLEMRAAKIIDRLTHGRVKGENPVRDSVKYAVYDLIAEIQKVDAQDGRTAKAMTNDGISVEYDTQKGGAYSRYAQIVQGYLEGETTSTGVSLLYAGVDA